MSSVARFDFQTDPPPTAGVAGSGGGNVEDVLRRLGSLEKDASAIKTEVGAITAQLPHLATKADLALVRADVSAVMAQLPQLATKADVASVKADISAVTALIPLLATKGDVSDVKASIIQWMVSTTLAAAALAFTIARFVH
ncbi:MAG TPA: hypothetical protein VIY50_11000 [Steroidobacteraceae bacterium]